MKTILVDNSKEIRFRKASQMAVSTYCILWTMWLCKTQIAKRGVIYWLPTYSLMKDFVNTKVDALVRENVNLKEGVSSSKDSYNLGLKYLFGVPTFWRGLESKSGVKSLSADAAIYDEFDEADLSQLEQARQRLSASELRLERELSVPTIPDFGIDKRFQETDQCHYSFRCPSCSTWNTLELDFPNCFKQNAQGDFYRACKKCSSDLTYTTGQWVQMNQSSKVRGYHITQLYSPFITPNEIMKEYNSTEFMGHFFNHRLGLPYLSATDRISYEQVLNLCNPMRSMPVHSPTTTFMGIDQGKRLHCVVMQPEGNRARVIWVGELTRFEDLDDVIKRLNVRRCVIDALPETRKARELKDRFSGKVYLNYYNEHQKGEYKWDDEQNLVSVNRTESLDVGTNMLFESRISLPKRDKTIEDFAKHCSNIAKVVEENKETGDRRFVYKKLGPDHYRHALNYALIAMSSGATIKPSSTFRT